MPRQLFLYSMPLHADEEEWNLIKGLKKYVIRRASGRLYDNFKGIVEKREENGWRRKSTKRLREEIHGCLGQFHPDFDSSDRKFDKDATRLAKLIDVFLVIYDSDDAYANMLHRFIEKCNEGVIEAEKGDLELKPRPPIGHPKRDEQEFEEKLNRGEADHSEFLDLDEDEWKQLF